MAKQGASNTALGAAICRLIEQYQPRETRLFSDPVVKDLVDAPIRVLMQMPGFRQLTIQQTNTMTPGIYGVQVCRTRFIDDTLRDALSRGIDQLVILGAGLDTRPYRLPGIERVKVFEVDLPGVQANKKKKVIKRSGKLPENVTYLPIDFDTQSLESVFSASSSTGNAFDFTRPAAFIWEGVSQYIRAESVRQTLAFVSTAAPGSILIFTYVLKSVIDRQSNISGINALLDRMKTNGSSWVFGLDPHGIAAFLQPYPLEMLADVGHEDYQQKYLRPAHRELAVSEIERIAVVRVLRQ